MNTSEQEPLATNNANKDRLSSPRKAGLLCRAVVGLFVGFIIILLIIATVLIVTQKPVDLSHVHVASETPVADTRTPIRPFRKYPAQPRNSTYRKFTFDDLFSGKVFLKDSYSLAWRKDGSLLKNKDEFNQVDFGSVSIDPKTFEATDFIDDASLQNTISSNEKYAYYSKIVKHGFRHSNEEVYAMYRIDNGTVLASQFPVGPTGNGTEIISLLKWNPNTARNDFIFVHAYNIYYQSDPEKPGTAVRITENGNELLRYGVPDWLYEEEIFQSKDAVWWSETGRYVAYMRFDDRAVNKIFVPRYSATSAYTQYQEISYPKAGVENNPLNTLYIWDRHQNKAVAAFPPAELTSFNQSYYVFSNTWMAMPRSRLDLGQERLVTIWANREQNHIYITLCNESDCVLTYSQAYVMSGRSMWAEPVDLKAVFPTKRGFFVILPHSFTDGNIYNHIAHMEIEPSGSGKVSNWYGGAYDVKEIKGYLQSEDILTFESAGGGIGTNKLYRIVKALKGGEKASVHPISSYLPDCEYGSYEVSPDGATAALSCNKIFKNNRLWIMDVSKPERNQLLDGEGDVPLPFDEPDISFEMVRLPSGYDAHIGIMKPPNFDPTRKYPVLLDVYGGPNSNRVKRVTPGPNFIHYCSNYEIIIVWVDARGSGNRGWNIKAPVYKLLGQFEAIDTLDAIKVLSSKYDYIDQANVAIFGWSYGGFLSTHVVTIDQGHTIKCAIAVAPVTDFALYDSAYTERYMGMPLENLSGYNVSRLIGKAALLRNVKFMLAHGEADDNVHYQHSALFAEALQTNMIHFTQLVYGNQDHSLGGRQKHLFREIGSFLSDCFGLTP